jgi:hypothetical protein
LLFAELLRWIARAKSTEGERAVKETTDAACKLGIFGAPRFPIGQGLFWGDDLIQQGLDRFYYGTRYCDYVGLQTGALLHT